MLGELIVKREEKRSKRNKEGKEIGTSFRNVITLCIFWSEFDR